MFWEIKVLPGMEGFSTLSYLGYYGRCSSLCTVEVPETEILSLIFYIFFVLAVPETEPRVF